MNNRKTEACSESLNILRPLVLVRLLSDRYQGLTMNQIRDHLQKRRLLVSDRQLQRDMQLLTNYFGIGSEDDDDDPRCKRWMQQVPASWRNAFSSNTLGNTDRGSDPFRPDSSESTAIVVRPQVTRIPSRVLRLIRILLIVESLPSDDEGTWVGTSDIVKTLRSKGLTVTVRTIQRDLLFIREHFLVLVSIDGSRRALWKRIDDGSWEYSFEPRFPTNDLGKHAAVQNFLYRMPPPHRWMH